MSNPFIRPRPLAFPPSAPLPRRAALTIDPLGVADQHLRQRRLATGLTVVTLLTVAAIAWAGLSIPEPTPECSKVVPTEEITFLVDATDPLSPEQQQFVAGKVQEAADHLAVGGRLRLVQLDPRADGSSPLSEAEPLCKPRDGGQASFLTENRRLLKGFFDQHFRAPLEQAMAKLNQAHPAKTTPLIEGLQALARRLAGAAQSPRRDLVIFSDLLQHSPLLTQYRGGYGFAALAQQQSAYLQGLDGFRGLGVVVYRLKHGTVDRKQATALRQFWADYFQAAGARDYRVYDL
jgi:hypothetical protein